MEYEKVKKYLQKEAEEEDEDTKMDQLPYKFFEPFIFRGLRTDVVEHGRVVCSFTVPPRLLNSGSTLEGGAIVSMVDMVGGAAIFSAGAPPFGVSVKINISYLDVALLNEEIEIEAKVLHVGKVIAVVSIELRKKVTGKIIAQGRHTVYLPITSKM